MLKKIYNIKVLQVFILLQPIIDIITSVMINEFNLDISLGMIVRFAFLLYALVYIFINKDKKIVIYIAIWIIYLVTNLVGNYFVKDNFNIFKQGVLLAKMVYFPLILLFFVLYLKNNKELDNKVFINVSLLVGLSLVISYLTKTAYCSYENYDNCYTKGVVAWFNSANEYGLILIALLGFTINEFVKKASLKNEIALYLIILFLCILGTKASFVGVVGVITLYVIYYLITCFFDRTKFVYFKKVFVLIITIFVIAISTRQLPIYTNLVGAYENAYNEAINEKVNNLGDGYCKTENEIKEDIQTTMIFNGRNDFIVANKTIYRNSSLFNKLFGITTQGNYYEGLPYNHINERDFHDLLIYYGIIGFIVEMLLPIYLLVKVFKKIFKNIKILFKDEIMIYIVVISIMLFGSFIAGHCLFQPAVSIYLAYLITLFCKKVEVLK